MTELTDPMDRAFAAQAQGALVNGTTLPSGYVTPDHDLIIRGTALVTPTAEELARFNQMKADSAARKRNFNSRQGGYTAYDNRDD